MGTAGDWGGVEYLGLVVSRCFNDDKEWRLQGICLGVRAASSHLEI